MTTASLFAAATTPLWWDGMSGLVETRPPLARDVDVDVAIVGAGYTGLWTAYALLDLDPSLRITIVDGRHVGFGASGRNGGWCSDHFAADLERIERLSDLTTATDFGSALRDAVDVVGAVAHAEGISCDFHKGGTIEFLRNGAHLARAEDDVAAARRYGLTETDLRVLSAGEASEIGRASNLVGGLWSAHTAAIQPAKLAHGLAAVLEGRGVEIYEKTSVVGFEPGRIVTDGGAVVDATVVVRATEGYTAAISGSHRALAPLYSIMIATEPLPASLWDEIGLDDRPTFADMRHLVIYGQRTADGRIAFGGRGAPYDYGSRVRHNADFPPERFLPVREALVEVFPQLAEVAITHRWGGVLGVKRTWLPTVTFDPESRLATAGGYVGSGVAVTNLAGRTIAHLVTGRASPLTGFPWVNRPVRNWEPEPLRWLGINSALKIMASADAVESRINRPAKRADLLWKLVQR